MSVKALCNAMYVCLDARRHAAAMQSLPHVLRATAQHMRSAHELPRGSRHLRLRAARARPPARQAAAAWPSACHAAPTDCRFRWLHAAVVSSSSLAISVGGQPAPQRHGHQSASVTMSSMMIGWHDAISTQSMSASWSGSAPCNTLHALKHTSAELCGLERHRFAALDQRIGVLDTIQHLFPAAHAKGADQVEEVLCLLQKDSRGDEVLRNMVSTCAGCWVWR
jgi:hypothetical protein